jgi:uncharacterized membrane protein YbjE (DUF340 family)
MWWFILTFIVGLAVGKFHILPTAFLRRTSKIISPCLIVLVLLLGYQLGSQHDLIEQLPQIGWHAAVIAVLGTAGSALSAWLTQPFFFPTQKSGHVNQVAEEGDP